MDERLKAALAANPGLTTFELDLSSGALRGDKRFWQLHSLFTGTEHDEQSLTRFLEAVHEADRARGFTVTDSGITVVGKDARVD